jgi:hypothetical protein
MTAVIALGKEPAAERSWLDNGIDAEELRHGASPTATAEPPARADQRSRARRVSCSASALEAARLLAAIGLPSRDHLA